MMRKMWDIQRLRHEPLNNNVRGNHMNVVRVRSSGTKRKSVRMWPRTTVAKGEKAPLTFRRFRGVASETWIRISKILQRKRKEFLTRIISMPKICREKKNTNVWCCPLKKKPRKNDYHQMKAFNKMFKLWCLSGLGC